MHTWRNGKTQSRGAQIRKPIVLDDLFYGGEDMEMLAWIQSTLSKLPEEVAVFAIDQCRFISVGKGAAGLTLPGRIGVDNAESPLNVWIIVLDENISSEHMESVIAHEIAHAWLGHDRIGDIPDDGEIVAANLTKEWGFTGHGADAEFSDRPYRS